MLVYLYWKTSFILSKILVLTVCEYSYSQIQRTLETAYDKKNVRFLKLNNCIIWKQFLAVVRSRFTDLLLVRVCEEVCGEEHKSPQKLLRIRVWFQVLLEKATYYNIKSELGHRCSVMSMALADNFRLSSIEESQNWFLEELLPEKNFDYFLLLAIWLAEMWGGLV